MCMQCTSFYHSVIHLLSFFRTLFTLKKKKTNEIRIGFSLNLNYSNWTDLNENMKIPYIPSDIFIQLYGPWAMGFCFLLFFSFFFCIKFKEPNCRLNHFQMFSIFQLKNFHRFSFFLQFYLSRFQLFIVEFFLGEFNSLAFHSFTWRVLY